MSERGLVLSFVGIAIFLGVFSCVGQERIPYMLSENPAADDVTWVYLCASSDRRPSIRCAPPQLRITGPDGTQDYAIVPWEPEP